MERQPVGIEPADDLVMVRIKPGWLNEALVIATRFSRGPVILVSDKLTASLPTPDRQPSCDAAGGNLRDHTS